MAHSSADLDVALVRWPEEETIRQRLASSGRPRLLLVDRTAEPPVCVDHLEDWVRLPASPADTRARVTALTARIQRLTPLTPRLDDEGTVRYRTGRVELPPLQSRLVAPLIDRFGAVVSRQDLSKSAWPADEPTSNTLDVHIVRLRRRLAPLGLEIRTVRSRGYLLTASQQAD